MSYLLDVNVLIALAWPSHVHHEAATEWFAGVHAEGWATTPVTEAGFIRVSSNPRVFVDGVSPGQAAALLGQFHTVAGHEFWPDTARLTDYVEQISQHVLGFGLVSDAHLALVALSNEGALATFDTKAAMVAQSLGAHAKLLRTRGQ
jgi:toxin-antitoxin system PIN domain toxin